MTEFNAGWFLVGAIAGAGGMWITFLLIQGFLIGLDVKRYRRHP